MWSTSNMAAEHLLPQGNRRCRRTTIITNKHTHTDTCRCTHTLYMSSLSHLSHTLPERKSGGSAVQLVLGGAEGRWCCEMVKYSSTRNTLPVKYSSSNSTSEVQLHQGDSTSEVQLHPKDSTSEVQLHQRDSTSEVKPFEFFMGFSKMKGRCYRVVAGKLR